MILLDTLDLVAMKKCSLGLSVAVVKGAVVSKQGVVMLDYMSTVCDP